MIDCNNVNSASIVFDDRWIGLGGIGVVAEELQSKFQFQSINIGGLPSSPLDPIRLSIALCGRMKENPSALFFSPGYNAPLLFSKRFVFVIHDLNHIDREENGGVLKRIYYDVFLKRACASAFKVLTVSEFSRNRICQWSGLASDDVVNIGNGVNPRFSHDAIPMDVGFPYFLVVGNRKKHKNDARTVEAFLNTDMPGEVRLIFTGSPDEQLIRLADRAGAEDRLIFLGNVPSLEMPRYYRGAIALLFPSLYEGFGLPVVEAMACGTPVLTSNTTALSEVAGDAALMVNPESIQEIAEGIAKLYSDSDLRSSLSVKGLAHSRNFTWDVVFSRVADVLISAQTAQLSESNELC